MTLTSFCDRISHALEGKTMEDIEKIVQSNAYETLKKSLNIEHTTINSSRVSASIPEPPKIKKDYRKITTEMYAHRENILKGEEIPPELAQDLHDIIESGNILELLNNFDYNPKPQRHKFTIISKPGKRVAKTPPKFALNREASKIFTGTSGVLISATAAILACIIIFSVNKDEKTKARNIRFDSFVEELVYNPFPSVEIDLYSIFSNLSNAEKLAFLLTYYDISYADFENICLGYEVPLLAKDSIENIEVDTSLFTTTFNSLSINDRLNYILEYYNLNFCALATSLESPKTREFDPTYNCFMNIYNSLSTASKINYMLKELNISYLDFEYIASSSFEVASSYGLNAEIYEIFQSYFSNLSLDNRLTYILSETNLSYEEFENLASSEEMALNNGYTTTEYQVLHTIYKSINEAIFNELLATLNLTYNQFYKTVQGILAEGGAYSYKEAYAITTTILNRTIDIGYINSVNALYGPSAGRSIYYQAIKPGQFQVYDNGSYKKYVDIESYPGYQAIIDCLRAFVLNPSSRMHNYKEFRSNNTTSFSNIMFTPTGNRYDIPLNPSKISLPEFSISLTLERVLKN